MWLSPTPLKNMSSSIGMIIPNIWENKKCSKPPTSIDSKSFRDLTIEPNKKPTHPQFSSDPSAENYDKFPSLAAPRSSDATGFSNTIGSSLVIRHGDHLSEARYLQISTYLEYVWWETQNKHHILTCLHMAAILDIVI